jgi:putative drug exporter of the RND superfamily
MHLIGPANWALPRWLDRILPRLALEPAEPALDGPGHTAPRHAIRG